MQGVIIENTNRYMLASLGNGAAYEMTDKATGETRFSQYGDDATSFRREYDAIAEAHDTLDSAWFRRSWNDCLAYLFNDCLAVREIQ